MTGFLYTTPLRFALPVYHLNAGDNIPGIVCTPTKWSTAQFAFHPLTLASLGGETTSDQTVVWNKMQCSRPHNAASSYTLANQILLITDLARSRDSKTGPERSLFAQLGVIPAEAREEKRRSTKAKDTTRSFSVHLLIKEVYGEQASYWIRPGRRTVSTYHRHLL